MATLDRLHRFDRRLFRRIAGWRRLPPVHAPAREPVDRVVIGLSNAADMSKLWLAVSALLSLTGPRGCRAAARGLGSLAVTSAVVNVLVKPIFRRARPSRSGLPAIRRLMRPPSSTSFPSGHAASAAAFATGVSIEIGPAAAPVTALAAGVAYSRVYAGVHYPSDVLAGAAIGAGVALLGRRYGGPPAANSASSIEAIGTASATPATSSATAPTTK